MKMRYIGLLILAVFALGSSYKASAQTGDHYVVSTCGAAALFTAGKYALYDVMDIDGNTCTSGSGGGGGGGTVTQGPAAAASGAWPVYPVVGTTAMSATNPLFTQLTAGSATIGMVNLGTIGLAATAANQTSQITQETTTATGIGTPADTAYAGSGNSSTIAALKGIYNLLVGTLSSTLIPSATGTAGITPVVSAAAEGSHVLKASAGNLYGLIVTSGMIAGYVMVFNATTAPADGAVMPLECSFLPANGTVSISADGSVPAQFSTGITAVFSSTGCFTKTASATAFFSGQVK